MSLVDAIRDTQLQTMNYIHRSLLNLSGGRIGKTLGNMPVCKVTTTGRASGRPRTVMLTVPVQHDDTFVFVASKGGDDRDPDWYRNLVSNPELTLESADADGPITLIARTASTEEKAELWPQIVAAYKGYARYQDNTDRDIPIVIAEPAAS